MPQPPKAFLRIIATFTACILLAACATVQTSPQTIGDPKYKIINNPDSPYKTAAGQLLEKLVNYIEPIEKQEDVTVDDINKAFDLALIDPDASKIWGNGRRLSPDWSYGVSLNARSAESVAVNFDFSPVDKKNNHNNPVMEPVCEVDLNQLRQMFKKIGFTREIEFRDNGWFHLFGRDKGRIAAKVFPAHKNLPNGDATLCVRRVQFTILGSK